MKFSCERDELIGPLQTVNSAIERRQTMAVLSNVLAEVEGNTLKLTGTDLELEVRTSVPVSGEMDGQITIPARKFSDICRSLPEGARIDCQLSEQRLTIKSGRSKFALSCLPADDFPTTDEVENGQSIDLSAKLLRQALQATHFAMAVADVRFYLNGMLWEIDASSLCCVATDAHRLAKHTINQDWPQIGAKTQLIVPRKAITEVMRLLSDSGEKPVRLSFNERNLQIDLGVTRFTSKLLEGRYPDYERVIPGQCDHWITGDTSTLKSSLQRVSILSNEKYRGVRLKLGNDTMTIQSHNPEHEEAEEQLSIDYVGEELAIGFNVSYLLDALGAIDNENYNLGLSGPDASGVIKVPGREDTVFVVMPMRL
ncbi:MAG: DNA polymerase III subunit beta [Oceanococcaceae bacterium]